MKTKTTCAKMSFKQHVYVALSAAVGSGAAFVLWNFLLNPQYSKNIKTELNKSESTSASEEKIHFFRYIDEFLSLKCVTDLIEHKVYPNAKEITESFSILHSLRKYLNSSSKDFESHYDYNFENKNVTALVIGDGSTPRIASLLCYITKWNNVYSIDPQLKIKKNKSWNNIRHLKCLRSKIEDITIKINDNNNVIVIFMHSHVLLEESLLSISFNKQNNNKHKMAVITVPCCQYMNKHKTLYNQQPDYTFTDISMASNKNTFYIWKDVTSLEQF
eukprot:157496_1